MRLNTRIYNAQGEQVNYEIYELSYQNLAGEHTQVSISVDGVDIGSMQYSIQQDHLYIHRMYNHTVHRETPFRHVGTLLLEYAFKKSLKAGKEGKIELMAINASPAFYYKMGLRRKSQEALILEKLFAEYTNTRSPLIKSKIMQDLFYESLKKEAAKYLGKDSENISFEEAIEFGCYSSANPIFEKELASGKQLTSTDCYLLNMNGIMYFPPENRALKKQEFFNFTPIGSNYFFSETEAECRLKNKELLTLMKTRKIDSSNAVEIEAKIDKKSWKWRLLLSDYGLKMMKRNYISGWYICVYFHNINDVQAIVSSNGFTAFKEGIIRHINQLVHAGNGMPALLLSDNGLQALKDGSVVISNTGYSITDQEGNRLDYLELQKIMNKGSTSAPST